MADPTKTRELPGLEDRIRAYIRAVMVDERLGLNEMAARLGEDKGALSAMLRASATDGGRAPSLWIVYRLRAVFEVDTDMLLTKDPSPEFFKPGLPNIQRTTNAPRRQRKPRVRPSDASQAAAAPAGKRHSS